ncbi:MAG: hypothetical protein WD749_14220 [Phycisphaerales bacterium]
MESTTNPPRPQPRPRRRGAAKLTVARTLAPEDIRPGAYIAVAQTVFEFFPYWLTEAWRCPPVFRVALLSGPESGLPLRVKEVCLPFVLVQAPDGAHRTLDTRRVRLMLLSDRFGRKASKKLRAKPRPGPCGL